MWRSPYSLFASYLWWLVPHSITDGGAGPNAGYVCDFCRRQASGGYRRACSLCCDIRHVYRFLNKIINHVSSLLLFHEIIHGNLIDSFATIPRLQTGRMSLLAFFARVRGIADCNKMSENLNKARVDFRREINALSEKSISNAAARIVTVPRPFQLRGSLDAN